MDFPAITAPSYPLTEEWDDISLASEFEDGSQQTRLYRTKSRGKWTLTWNLLPQSEYDTLMSFIKTQAKFRAVAFNWTHPFTDVTYEVRLAEAPSDWQTPVLNYWKGSITLQEV